MITEEKINVLIEHCKRQKESFSRLIKEEHSNTLECLEELLDLRKSTKWHDLRKNPNDLPPLSEDYIFSEYVLACFDKNPNESCSIPYYYVVYYNYNNKFWLDNGCIIDNEAIAWMELPQFKK